MILLIILFGLWTFDAHCQERELVTKLLTNYTKTGRPLTQGLQPVEVTIESFRMIGLESLNEMTATLSLHGWFYIHWYDYRLSWKNDSEYSHVRRLFISDELVWTPDITIISTSNKTDFIISRGKQVEIGSDGKIGWFPTGQLTTHCVPNLRMFPFDSQVCDLRIESWSFTNDQLMIKSDRNMAFKQVTTRWIENSAWTIIGNSSIVGKHYSSANLCYSFVVFRLLLRRKPMYQVVTIVMPSMIISTAELVVFCLPCTDPTRVQISFTCLLAYTVFQSMIMQSVPRTIDSVPLMSLFIDLQMFYIGFIAIIGDLFVFSLLGNPMETKPSKNLIKQATNVGKSIGLKGHVIRTHSDLDDVPKAPDMLLDSEYITLKEAFDQWRRVTAKNVWNKQWLFIAQIVQRIIFIVYASLLLITPIALVVAAYAIGDELHFFDYETSCQ